MLPPNRVCSAAPIDPTKLRERTTMPRTMPRLRTTQWPGSSNAVVTLSRKIAMAAPSELCAKPARLAGCGQSRAAPRHRRSLRDSRLSSERHDDLAPHRCRAVLPQIDALPRAQAQLAVANRHRQLVADDQATHVRGHVVGTFRVVPEHRVAVRRDALSESFQVAAHLGIGILRDTQAGAGVAQKQMAHS